MSKLHIHVQYMNMYIHIHVVTAFIPSFFLIIIPISYLCPGGFIQFF